MASIQKEIDINRSRETVWNAIRDIGNIHKRLVVRFVTDCKLDGDWRTITRLVRPDHPALRRWRKSLAPARPQTRRTDNHP